MADQALPLHQYPRNSRGSQLKTSCPWLAGLVMPVVFRAMRLSFDVLLRLFFEGLFATSRAEVVRLPLVIGFTGSGFRINIHTANRVFHHKSHLLSLEKNDVHFLVSSFSLGSQRRHESSGAQEPTREDNSQPVAQGFQVSDRICGTWQQGLGNRQVKGNCQVAIRQGVKKAIA